MNVFHSLFLLTCIFGWVGGETCINGCWTCKVLSIDLSVLTCSVVPILIFLWCIQNMCIVEDSVRGLFNLSGFVGSKYVIVSAGMYVTTCVSGKGPIFGVRF